MSLTRLSTFKSIWSSSGWAPSNRFSFLVSPPPALFDTLDYKVNLVKQQLKKVFNQKSAGSTIAGTTVSELLQFACKKIELPSSAFNVVSTNVNGSIKNRAASRDYDPITMEFYIDSKYLVYQFFLSWHNLIMNTFNKRRSYPKDYLSAQSSLILWDNENKSFNPSQDITFANIWPSEIGKVTMDWEDDSQVMILPVTFHFDHFYNAWQDGFFKSSINRGVRSIINSGNIF
jgi:hypothetical protein